MCWSSRCNAEGALHRMLLIQEIRMKDLAGKTAFVTGAASGIGLGIAGALAQAGVKVMLCDIEEAALAKAVEGLKRTNADVDGVKADVSLKSELKAAADADDRPLWQGAHSRQQRGRGRRRAIRRMDRRGMGLDAWRQSHGGHLGDRDFRPVDRTSTARADISCRPPRSPGWSRRSQPVQRIQIRRRRAFGGPARRSGRAESACRCSVPGLFEPRS